MVDMRLGEQVHIITSSFHINCLASRLTTRACINFDDPRKSRATTQMCTTNTYDTELCCHLLPVFVTASVFVLCAELVHLVRGNTEIVLAGGKQYCFDSLINVLVYLTVQPQYRELAHIIQYNSLLNKVQRSYISRWYRFNRG